MLDVDAYLARLGLSRPPSKRLAGLTELHLAHLIHVPFENLDIRLGHPIRLEPDPLFDKVVSRRRGGFCYELNGLFALLLEALGYPVARLSGRVHDAGNYGPPFDHLALEVDVGFPALVDVGFGDAFRAPLRLDTEAPQLDLDGRWLRVARDGEEHVLLRRDAADAWEPLYRFSRQPHRLEAFEGVCRFHQTSPSSPFTRRWMVTRALPEGRVTLGERALTFTRHGQRTRQPLEGPHGFAHALAAHFGLRLELPAALPTRASRRAPAAVRPRP